MRGGCVYVAALAVTFGLISYQSASADGSRATVLLFSGADLWRNGGFLHGGALWAPGGLDREGLTFKAVIAGGSYRYISGALGNTEVKGRELTTELMAGWHFIRGRTELKIFAGLDLQDHRLSPDDVSASLRGSAAGVRTSFDLWSEPTPQTMIEIDGSLSSIGASYSLHGAAGWRIASLFYVGPEMATFGANDYRQHRFGLHATGFRTGQFEWNAAGGFARDNDDRSGAYIRFGVSTRR